MQHQTKRRLENAPHVPWCLCSRCEAQRPTPPGYRTTPIYVDVEHLFTEWSAATSKSDYITALPLKHAQLLLNLIIERVPCTYKH